MHTSLALLDYITGLRFLCYLGIPKPTGRTNDYIVFTPVVWPSTWLLLDYQFCQGFHCFKI